MNFSPNNAEISKAFVAAWGNMKNPKENATANIQSRKENGSSYSYKYTDLKGLLDAARETLASHGISVMQNSYTEQAPNGSLFVCVETMMLHISGEWVKAYPLKYKAPDRIQEMGGLITSMKRYALSSMLGVASESGHEPYNGKNYSKQNDYSNQNSQNNKPNKTQNNQEQIAMPKNAVEAGQILLPFGRYQGQSLKELYTNKYDYLTKICNDERTPQAIKKGFTMMAEAVALKNAKINTQAEQQPQTITQ